MSVSQDIKTHTEIGSWKGVIQATATHCCVCRRRLTDAESVEHGIGPVCSSRYYSPKHSPDGLQVASAMGELVGTKLPANIVEAVMDRRDKARSACNILVYWASAHFDDRAIVFDCTRVIREFGYKELADKLEDDRTSVSLRTGKVLDEDTEDRIIVMMKKRDGQVLEQLRSWAKGRQEKRKGTQTRISCPVSQKAKVEIILGYRYGKELACVEAGFYTVEHTGVHTIPARSWTQVRALDPRRVPVNSMVKPVAQGKVRVDPNSNGTFAFYSPYNGDWLDKMKRKIRYKDRQWAGGCWVFRDTRLQVVKDLAQEFYGVAL